MPGKSRTSEIDAAADANVSCVLIIVQRSLNIMHNGTYVALILSNAACIDSLGLAAVKAARVRQRAGTR